MIKLDPKVILLFLCLYFGFKYKDKVNLPVEFFNKPTAVVTVLEKNRTIQEPSDLLKQSVIKITERLKHQTEGRDNKADAFLVGDFYGDFADVIIKADIIKTNKALKEHLITCGKLVFTKGDISGAYPGLEAAILGESGAISQALGLEAGLADLKKQYDVLKAIQWAAYQAVK